MNNYLKSILIFIYLTVDVFSLNIAQKYPSYTYVFNEFDVDKSYIYDADFSNFVLKHEKNMKAFYRRSLRRGVEILPTMKGMLMGQGVSDLFIYLSMVESGFSSNAVSPKKAVGLWQFMPETAKQYNLTVSKEYDERQDTFSSTLAAIKYLNKLHKQFGKWYLAAMAYNCGEGCVERAIKKAGTDGLIVLTDDKLKYLPNETREYIKKILLLAMIGENITLGLGDNLITNNKSLVKVEVRAGTQLRVLAKVLKMDYKVLQKLNRKIKKGIVPKNKNTYEIIIPIEKIFAFYLRYELKEKKVTKKENLISHYVSLGETLETIADKYDTTSEEIIQTNHLDDKYLMVGQLLIIPVSNEVLENIHK